MANPRNARQRQKDSSKNAARKTDIKIDAQDDSRQQNSSTIYKAVFVLVVAVVGIATFLVLSGRTSFSQLPDAVLNVNERPQKDSSEQPKVDKKKLDNDERFKSITNKFDQSIGQALKKAQKLLDQGNIDKAWSEFSFLVGKYPNSPRSRFGKAQALDKKAEKERSNSLLLDSINIYAEVPGVEECPDDLKKQSLRRMTGRLTFLGRYRQATGVLERLSNIFPTDVDILNELGIQFLLSGDNKRALLPFQKALKLNSSSGCAKSHIGFILKNDQKLKEAIPYLEEGIHSGEQKAVDGNFFFHLGDAYHRLGKSDSAMRVYKEAAEKGFFLSAWQRSLYNADTKLKAQPWWSQEETGYKKELAKLEANWNAIRDEAISQLDLGGRGGFEKEAEGLRDTGDWQQLTLFARGQRDIAGCKRTPRTCAIISDMIAAVKCTRGQIKFSVMHPGTHVWPHTGPTNCRLRAHLGLVVPKNVFIRAGNDTRTWQEGKVLVFDDSFEHEVWHNGTSFRLILIIDFWHPELKETQRRRLTPI